MLKRINQTNYISNHDCLVNIERIDDAFWSGLVIGSLFGLFIAFHLMSDKKKENKSL